MKKRLSSLLLVLSVAGLPALNACKKPENKEGEAKATAASPAVKVSTGDVQLKKLPKFLTLTGSVLANQESQVAANVSGRVIATYVERGQPVKKGQVLVAVDSQEAGLSASAAAAQSKVADTQEQLAQQDCERADKLFAQGAMTKAEYERQKTQCSSQVFSANAARASADLATKRAGDAQIRAPFDGFVGERFVNVGEYVQPPTRVASFYSIDPARIQISVPENAVALLKAGQTLELTVAAYPERSFPATVKYISPALRTNTRDLVVEATAKNSDASLRPGMFATVLLAVGEEELPTVPKESLRVEGTVKRLFLARQGKAFEMVVQTGITRDGRIAVLDSITAADKVILNPPKELKDGAVIQ